MESTKTERYGVARHDTILSLHDTLEEARQQHAHVSQTMGNIGLESDVDLVSVTVTTTYSKPKLVKDEPEPEADAAPVTEEPAD